MEENFLALNYINGVVKLNPDSKILVIATNSYGASPWKDRLPNNVEFVDFGKLYFCYSFEKQQELLYTLLRTISPKIIHNINSGLGQRVFSKNGKELKKIFSSL